MNIIKVERPGKSSGFIKMTNVKHWYHNISKDFAVIDNANEATRFNDTETKLVLGFMGLSAHRKGHKLDIVNV